MGNRVARTKPENLGLEKFKSEANLFYMAATLRTIQASVSADGIVTLDKPVSEPRRAILTSIEDEAEENHPDAEELQAMLEAEADRAAGNREAFTSLSDLKAKLGICNAPDRLPSTR